MGLALILVLLSALPGLAAGDAGGGALPGDAPLASARAVLELRREDALRGRAVRLRGMVAAYDHREDALYLQDLSAGIRVRGVHAAGGPASYRIREMVEVEGRTGAAFSPEVVADRIRLLGAGDRLQPTYIDVDEMMRGRSECQWLRGYALITNAKESGPVLELKMTVARKTVSATLLNTNGAPPAEAMIGRMASFIGVCVAETNSLNQFTGARFLVPDSRFFVVGTLDFYDKHGHTNTVAVLESLVNRPAKAATNAALKEVERNMAKDIMTYGTTRDPARLIGVVQLQSHTNRLFLADSSGVVTVYFRGAEHYEPGERLEVLGNPLAGPFLAEIRQAKITRLGRAALDPPLMVSGADRVMPSLSGRRIRLEGKVTGFDYHEHGSHRMEVAIVQADAGLFDAHFQRGTDLHSRLTKGCRAEFTGVCEINKAADSEGIRGFLMYVNSINDVVVIKPAPLISAETLEVVLKTALGLGILCGAWIVLLRYQVRRRTSELKVANRSLQEEVVARQKAENEAHAALTKEKELVQLKSRFVSMVSHEFRTPLGVIQSSSDILERYHDRLSAEKRKAQLRTVRKAVRRMSNLMEDVLMLARFENEKIRCHREKTDIGRLCRRCVRDVAAATGGKCEIRLTLAPPAFQADVDEALLTHALLNLFSNAVKYSPAGSPVEAEVAAENGSLSIRIADQGCGIPAADLPRLFTGFYRAGNVANVPGSGLGLVIVKRCVDLHGGELQIDSKEGSGTTIQIRLPIACLDPLEAPGVSDTDFVSRPVGEKAGLLPGGRNRIAEKECVEIP